MITSKRSGEKKVELLIIKTLYLAITDRSFFSL